MDDHLPAGPPLTLTLDETTRTLCASLAHDTRFPRIDALWLRDRLGDAGYADVKIRPQAIKELIARYNAGESVPPLDIADCLDASLQITTTIDGLCARLTIVPAKGGKAATKTELLALLAAKGIVEGVRVDEINRAIAAGKADELVIAVGREPVPGEDGRLEYLLPDMRERVPSIRPCGRTDFRDLGEILVVATGDALMRRHPPTRGEDGLSVFGKPIAPKPGKDTRFASGLRGVSLSAQDPDLLVAACDGQPVRVRGGIIVEPIYTVDAVNMATGNINFDGTVKVRNDVQAGMSIRASGDIEVGGVVEPATLEAGGNIIVRGGVMGGIGGKTAGKDLSAHAIRCEGSFSATYAQQARITAGDSIFIDDLAMQCQLQAANHVRIGNLRRGHIIGGKTHACLSIHARVIGAPNRIRTELEIGSDTELARAVQEKAQERDGKENRLLEIGKLLTVADRNPGRVTPDMLARAEQAAAALSAEIEALRGEEDDLRFRLELAQQARVNAEQAIHEGVSVSMGDNTLRIPQERGPTTVRLSEQGLAVFPLEDDSHFDAPQRPGAETGRRR